METLVKEQAALIRDYKNQLMENSLALATLESRLSAVENMPKIAWALQPAPVTTYMLEGIVNNTYDLNGKYRIKIQGGSKMRIRSNNRWKNKSLTPHENKWIQSWGDSSLLFDQPKAIWQKVEKYSPSEEAEKEIERICNPRITLEWGWTSHVVDTVPVVPSADVASLGTGEDWVRIAMPKNNSYEKKGGDELIKKELIPPALPCWKLLHYLPGRAGDKSNKLPRLLAYAPASVGKYPHEVWNWYTQAHLSGNWIKNSKIKITPIGQAPKILRKTELHSSSAKRLSDMVREQQEQINDQNEKLSNIRMIARYEYAHKSARKAAETEITEIHNNHREELEETRQQLKEALEEIDRRNKEIHKKKEKKKEIRGPGRRVKQKKKPPEPIPEPPEENIKIPKIVRNNPAPTINFRDELLKKQKSNPKPKLSAPRGPTNRLRQKQEKVIEGRLDFTTPQMPNLPPPKYYGNRHKKKVKVKKREGEVDLWNTMLPGGLVLSNFAPDNPDNEEYEEYEEYPMNEVTENNNIAMTINEIKPAVTTRNHRVKQKPNPPTDMTRFSVTMTSLKNKQDKPDKPEKKQQKSSKQSLSVIISGATGKNSNIINGKYVRIKGKNYIYSRGELVEEYNICLYLAYDKKWWIGTLKNGLKRIGSGWAHTKTETPSNKNSRILPVPQDIADGNWEVMVAREVWKSQNNMKVREC